MDFVQEVNEDYRQEQLLKTWKKIQPLVLGVVGLVLVVSLGVIGYNKYDESKREKASDKYMHALNLASVGKIDESIQALDHIPGGLYGTMGQLGKALALARQNKIVAAQAVYEALMADKKAEPVFTEFARLQAAKFQLASKNATAALSVVEPLVKSSHWRVLATEIKGLALLQLGKKKESFDVFQDLVKSSSTPADIKDRAKVMIAYIDQSGEWQTPAPKDTK